MEGEDNKQVRTGSDGSFSFKLDKAATGERTVTLALSKDGFADRRFNITFTRLWKMEDYADYLDDQVRALSYENLSTQPEKFTDRIVRYEGHVLDVSGTDLRTYVHVATRQTKDGGWTDALIAVAEDETVLLDAGDSIVLYGPRHGRNLPAPVPRRGRRPFAAISAGAGASGIPGPVKSPPLSDTQKE